MCLRTVSLPKGRLVHAYLIFAHKNLDQLPRLIDRLDTGSASLYPAHRQENTYDAVQGRTREAWVATEHPLPPVPSLPVGRLQPGRGAKVRDGECPCGGQFHAPYDDHRARLSAQTSPRDRCFLRRAPRDFLHRTQLRKNKGGNAKAAKAPVQELDV